METVNPKNFIDIDPNLVSFITLKDGNMIMIDESTPAKPNKTKLFAEEDNNKIESLSKKIFPELYLSEQINFSFLGNNKLEEESNTIIKKNDFNLISNISKNINFSYISNNNMNNIQKNNIHNNLPSPNSSIDFKSSMFQTKRDNLINKNNINNNILSEDNVNINLTETVTSNQMYNKNGKNNDEIMPSNIFTTNKTESNAYNKNKRKLNIIQDTQKYTFNENTNNDIDNGNNIEKKDNNDDTNMKFEIKKNQIEDINRNNNNLNQLISINNNNGSMNNFNSVKPQIDTNEKSAYINNPSLIIQNNNFFSQNNYPKTNMNINSQNNDTEMNIDNKSRENRSTSKKYHRISMIKKKKDNNYIKAVVSINIPAEEQESINLVKQFNLLVDRLNGQKSKTKAHEIIKKSDRYYELYKNPNENILNSLLSPEKRKKQIKHNYLFDMKNNISNTSKYGDNSINNIYNNDTTNITYGKNNNLNSRILALKERTFTNMNNSFKNDNNIKENYKSNNINNKSDIVLPSNFAFNKKYN